MLVENEEVFMKDVVILCLSDLHFWKKDANLKFIQNSFLDAFQDFVKKNRVWMPEFITVSGDITQNGDTAEFQIAEEFLERIKDIIHIPKYQILATIGNHDIFWGDLAKGSKEEQQKKRKEYYEKMNKYLDTKVLVYRELSEEDKKHTEDMVSFCKPYFKNYTDFRQKFLEKFPEKEESFQEKVKYGSLPAFENSFLKYVNQYLVFEDYKLVFLELNNSWLSVYPGKDYKSRLRFGAFIVDYFNNELFHYKEEGYLIVALYHHSLFYLTTAEYQASNNSFCMYKSLVNLADLLVCGCNHGDTTEELKIKKEVRELFTEDIERENNNEELLRSLVKLSRDPIATEQEVMQSIGAYQEIVKLARFLRLKSTDLATEQQKSVYKILVDLVHVAVCGHEHGERVKQADCLANLSQQLMAGAFYERQREHMANIECSAFFIKLDRIHNVISVLEVTGKHEYKMEWNFHINEIMSYPLHFSYADKTREVFSKAKLSIPSVYVNKYVGEKEKALMVVRRLFGKRASLDEDYNLIDENGNLQGAKVVLKVLEDRCFTIKFDKNQKDKIILICTYTAFRQLENEDISRIKSRFEEFKQVHKKEIMKGRMICSCILIYQT